MNLFVGSIHDFLLAFLAMLLFNNSVSLSKQSPNITTDQLALLAFKAHIVTDPQQVLATNWSTATSVCNWIGITCGPRHHRVIALNLANMGLVGRLPPHLGNLSFLDELHIPYNSFFGSLPDELSNLRRLKVMELMNNNFSGGIPSSLCYLPKLEHMNLSGNNLQGQIPTEIENLSRLKTLALDWNQLSGSIPSSIFNLSSLQVIDLSNNQLSGSIPSMKRNMSSNLEYIDFGANKLIGHIRLETFDHTPKLRGLYLSWNQLSGRIPSELSKLKKLEELSLSVNNLEGNIPRELKNLTTHRFLYLGANYNLQGEIPQEIGELVSLQLLSIPQCNLIGTIPSAIGNLTFLQYVDFSFNNLTGTIPFAFQHLQNLEGLTLDVNHISGTIPPGIFNSSTLLFVSLSSNRLRGVLPSSMGLWLPKLENLHLGDNELNGLIPTSISNISRLIILTLAHNSFSGYIPNTLGNLRDLRRLNLGFNNLTSKPSSPRVDFLLSLANCKHLELLAFHGNPLISGNFHIPMSGNLSKSLQKIFAGGCSLSGSIPIEIGNLINLLTLAVEENQLTGTIPTTIGRLKELQLLSLSNNMLEGLIPSNLCLLEKLAFLYLQNNKLSGSVPACFGALTSLRELTLGSNNLNSSIPLTLTTIDILKLDLSSNSLGGSLPIDIGNWKAMIYMNLSGNQISGDIPTGIGELMALDSLSLSGNRLQGLIPESLGGLVALEYLDLSRNTLSGTIPRSLEKLAYLKYFNVSFNKLQGEIPNGGPFPNYSFQSFLGNEALCGALHLHVPPCRRSNRRSLKLVKYMLPPVVLAIVLILALIIICSRRRKRNAKLLTDQEKQQHLVEWRRFTYHELAQATDGFCESKLLGTGSFGSVYHGTLSDGINIAVKVFNLEIEGAFGSFDVECEVLRNIRHRNLVRIISSCCIVDFKALVLQFMPNGSLERWLYSHNHFLNLLQRLKIMIDVASALEYLHHGHTTPIVHCDLKPSNVLLDEDMCAHLSDFGISKLLGEGNSVTQTMTLATIGYMAPEYGSAGIISTKGDVYNFGILLMETFTRKKPVDETFTGEMSLRSWVQKFVQSRSTQVIDSNLLSGAGKQALAIEESSLSILQLGLECSTELPEQRMDMNEVAAKLKKIESKYLKDVGRV